MESICCFQDCIVVFSKILKRKCFYDHNSTRRRCFEDNAGNRSTTQVDLLLDYVCYRIFNSQVQFSSSTTVVSRGTLYTQRY